MANQGQAAGYYNNDQTGYEQPQQYGMQRPPKQYGVMNPDQDHNNGYDRKYPQAPPEYGQNFNPPQNNQQSFDQTFRIPKPRFNDLWAGILVSERGALYLDHHQAD